MTSIQIKNSVLIVEDKTKELFDWQHRTFFNISLGLKVDEENACYYTTEKDDFFDITNEIVNYLQDEFIEFNFDSAIGGLLSRIKSQNSEFEEAIRPHIEIKSLSNSISFLRKLKPYQIKGLEHFIQVKHGANFSVPGSGKTTMVYAYFDKLKEQNIVDKLFVVGPFSSFAPWEDESEKCFGRKLKSARLVGNKRQSYYYSSDDYELFLCHYQTVANDISYIIELCKKHRFLMVVDESHYIKRFEGGVWSNALLAIAPYTVRRVILSGTPMPNGYIDLWSQMTFLWYGKQLLGERVSYKNRCSNPSKEEEIKRQIRPFFYRVTKSELNLPEPNTIKTKYELKPIQRQIYHALSTKLLADLKLQPQDRYKLKQWRKAKMIRLIQSASNPTLLSQYSDEFNIPPLPSDGTSLVELIDKYSQFEIPAKFEISINIIKTLFAQGKKVILWTSFVHNIKMLENLLKGLRYYSIYGAVPKDDEADEEFNREKQIRNFKTINEPALLLANPAACAESISLHKICHDAIYLDRTFNCGQFIQSKDRIHRIGLEKEEIVNYHILIAKNTIDETIDRRLDEKFNTMKKVLEDEIPIGDLDVDISEMEQTESEEQVDFDATVNDIEKFLESH